MKHIDFSLFIICIGITVGVSILFLYCYFGKVATESYEKMVDCMYESNWNELSPHLQKYIVVMMANAQRTIYYHGFGVAVLNLGTFTKVRDTTFQNDYQISS